MIVALSVSLGTVTLYVIVSLSNAGVIVCPVTPKLLKSALLDLATSKLTVYVFVVPFSDVTIISTGPSVLGLYVPVPLTVAFGSVGSALIVTLSSSASTLYV